MMKIMNMMICHNKNDDFGQWPQVQEKIHHLNPRYGVPYEWLLEHILFLKAEYQGICYITFELFTNSACIVTWPHQQYTMF